MATFPAYTRLFWTQLNAIQTVQGPGPPTGFLWVVRDVVVTMNGSPPGANGAWLLQRNDTSPICGWAVDEVVAGHTYHWEGRQTLNVGQFLVANTSGLGSSWSVTGFELTA